MIRHGLCKLLYAALRTASRGVEKASDFWGPGHRSCEGDSFITQVQPGMSRPEIPWTLNRSYYGTPSEALEVSTSW